MKYITKYEINKNFSSTLINFIFQFEIPKEDIIILPILSRLLSFTNNNYNDESSFSKEKIRRYIMSYTAKYEAINKVYFMNFSAVIPNIDIVKDDFLEDAINFILDSIYNPNIKDGLFNQELFLREKDTYTQHLLDAYKNINFIAQKNMLDLLDQDGILNKIKYEDLENIKDLNNKRVYDFYNNYIYTKKPKIFVNGNTDIERLDNLISLYLDKLKLKKVNMLTDYNYYYNDFKYKEQKEESKYYQSIIYMVYNVKNYTELDKYKGIMLDMLLSNNSSSILLNILRKNNNLVYTCESSFLIRNGLLIIKASTGRRNINIVKKIIQELIIDLTKLDKYEKNIKDILYRTKLNLERELDSFVSISSNIINQYFKLDVSSEKEFQLLSSIKKEELEEFNSRLNLAALYVLEGTRE